jgi:hypothetical protein
VKIPTFIPSGELPQGLDTSDSQFVHESGFVHELNAHGYRSDDFHRRGDYAVLTIGCSWAFGYCVDYERTWSVQFCRAIAGIRGEVVTNWNVALPGVSNDYIARMALTCVPLLAPDCVLISFTNPARSEYWLGFDRSLHHRPSMDEPLERDERAIHNHLLALQSESHDMWRLFATFTLIDAVLKSHRVPWLYTFACVHSEPLIARWLSGPYIGSAFDRRDSAIDGHHPGAESHASIARKTVEMFAARYGNGGRVRTTGGAQHR